MWSHSVLPANQHRWHSHLYPSKAGSLLDLVTPEGCKAELTQLASYIPRWYTRPKMVTNPSTNRAWRRVTSLMLWQHCMYTTPPAGLLTVLLGARSCLCVGWYVHRRRRRLCCCCCWGWLWAWRSICQEVQPTLFRRSAHYRDTGHSAGILGLTRSVVVAVALLCNLQKHFVEHRTVQTQENILKLLFCDQYYTATLSV